jgi:phospholipase/carboxylesterase
MTFSLNTTIIKSDQNDKINSAIILLHGYGGDGKDISAITYNWKRFLPNTVFLCPDGFETCALNPNVFQWFDLSKDDPKYIIERSLKAEEIIHKFIKEVKELYKLNNSKICLSGFSQGCMMSINIGLTSDENFNCIVGFSGKIIDKENLSKRISSKTKMLLLHGELDTIVSPSNLLDAKDFLLRNKIEVETNMISDCDHHIPIKSSSIALNYLKKNFSI